MNRRARFSRLFSSVITLEYSTVHYIITVVVLLFCCSQIMKHGTDCQSCQVNQRGEGLGQEEEEEVWV